MSLTLNETHVQTVDEAPNSGAFDRNRAIALKYVTAILERARIPLPPLGFIVDWDDQPSRHKLYLDTTKLPLPAPFEALPTTGVHEAVSDSVREGALDRLDLKTVADLMGCYGILDRRTELNWNGDNLRKLSAAQASWGRPTASGGGMYPAEIYLVSGTDGPAPAGVYHYDTAHHSLDLVCVGDKTGLVAEATGTHGATYLVVTVKFWKNSFKYNSFCYHVVAQDVGCLLGSWRFLLGASGASITPSLWFDDTTISRVVGVDGQGEAPFMVVPFGRRSAAFAPESAPIEGARSEPHSVWERSSRPRTFELVEMAHAACTISDRERPNAVEPRSICPEALDDDRWRVLLPPCDGKGLSVAAALRARTSSFGLFCTGTGLSAAAVGSMLAATAEMGLAPTDVEPGPRETSWFRQWVITTAMDGVPARAYAYDARVHGLVAGPEVDLKTVQQLYPLTNYNLNEVGALIVISGRLGPIMEAYGARGYRVFGVEVGQAAEAIYLAGTAVGLGVGAVLGVDNSAIDRLLGFSDTDEQSLLCVMIGRDRTPTARFVDSLHSANTASGADS